MNKNNYGIGLILILLGLYLLLSQSFNLNLINFSTLIFLIIGLFFQCRYFKYKTGGENLVLGGLFLTMGIIKLIGDLPFALPFTLSYIREFSLGLSIGFFQLYIFEKKESGILLISIILFIFSILSLLKHQFYWINTQLLFPIALILFGVYILYVSLKNK